MSGNPIQTMIQMMNMGQDPRPFIQQMAGQNPQIAQFMQMINGRSPQQLRQMAENMAKERGVSINDVIRQLGITTPSGK